MQGTENQKVVCVDLDGTLSNDEHRHRLAPAKGSPLDLWQEYHLACADDTPIDGTIATLKLLPDSVQVHIISGRWEQMRKETEVWLAAHGISYDALRMYGLSDRPMKNYNYKVQYVEELRDKGFDPILFLENEPIVADYIEEHGALPVLCVNPRYVSAVA
jgi:FMN phosphatase YigB (HAD superfamily)